MSVNITWPRFSDTLLNMEAVRGDDWLSEIVFTDTSVTPNVTYDFTGCLRIDIQLRLTEDGTKALAMTTYGGSPTLLINASGNIEFDVPKTVTALLSGTYLYDILVTHADSKASRLYPAKNFKVWKDVTRTS